MPPYDYDKTQLRAVVQGVYETLVRERLGEPAQRTFGVGPDRLDVRAVRAGTLTRADVTGLMRRAFAIAVTQGQKHGALQPGTVKPTRKGVKLAHERLARGWSDADYELSLALARKPSSMHANPLPAFAIPAGVVAGAKAAAWSASIGMLAWEGYKMVRKKNPKTKQIARAGEGSALAVRGRRPADPQRLPGAFAVVPWQQDPQGYGYIVYTADWTPPRTDKVLRDAGLYLDRSLQKQFRKRAEGEIETEAERAGEALAEMDPVALARRVGPSSEAIGRDEAKRDPLLGWLRSNEAVSFFQEYPLRTTATGDLDLPDYYAEEISGAVQDFAQRHGQRSVSPPSDAAIYSTLKRIFGVRRVGAYSVEKTGIRVYRTPANPSLQDAVRRLAGRLQAVSGPDADIAGDLYGSLGRALRAGVADSPYEAQDEDINRAGLAILALELAKSGDGRGARLLRLKPTARLGEVQAQVEVNVASVYEKLTAGHKNVPARTAWLRRQVLAAGQAYAAQVQRPVRRNSAGLAARVAVRGAAVGARGAARGARSGAAAVRAWLATPRGQRAVGQAMGIAYSVGLQALIDEAAKRMTPRQADVLARVVSRETGIKVSREDVVTAMNPS